MLFTMIGIVTEVSQMTSAVYALRTRLLLLLLRHLLARCPGGPSSQPQAAAPPSQPQVAAQAGAASDSSMSGAGAGFQYASAASSFQDPSLTVVPEDQEMTPAHTVQLYTNKYGQMVNANGDRVDRLGRPTRARGVKGSGSSQRWNSGWR